MLYQLALSPIGVVMAERLSPDWEIEAITELMVKSRVATLSQPAALVDVKIAVLLEAV